MSEATNHREHLEQRANEVREKLEHRLRLIDERRHHVTDVARIATRPPVSIVLLAAAGMAAAIFIVQRLRARRAPTAAQLLVQLLQPPSPPPEPSLVGQRLRKAATSMALVAAERIGRQGLERWLAQPSAHPGPLD
jgi:hypothetical protein